MNIKESLQILQEEIEFNEIDKMIERANNDEDISSEEIKKFLQNLENKFHLSVEYFSTEFFDAIKTLKNH